MKTSPGSVFTVSYLPQVQPPPSLSLMATRSANDQDVAWRDFGFRVESELFDAEIRTTSIGR